MRTNFCLIIAIFLLSTSNPDFPEKRLLDGNKFAGYSIFSNDNDRLLTVYDQSYIIIDNVFKSKEDHEITLLDSIAYEAFNNLVFPIWSRDDSKIVFFDDEKLNFSTNYITSLKEYDIVSKKAETITTFNGLPYLGSYISLSRDGELYFYSNSIKELDLFSKKHSDYIKIDFSSTYQDGFLLSPDEKYFLMEGDVPSSSFDERALYLVPNKESGNDIKPIQITSDGFDLIGSWSPDSRFIVFTRLKNYESGYGNLYVYDTKEKEIKKITKNENTLDMYPSWSKDGQRIIFGRAYMSYENLYSLNLSVEASEKGMRLTNESLYEVSKINFSRFELWEVNVSNL